MLGAPTNWETCPLHNLLVRIMRLNKVIRSQVNIDTQDLIEHERDRLIAIYSRRVKEANQERK